MPSSDLGHERKKLAGPTSSAMPQEPTTNRLCPHCGATLGSDAPLGLCLRCLVRTGAAPSLIADESGGTSPGLPGAGSVIAPGPVEFRDYELLQEIGRGG